MNEKQCHIRFIPTDEYYYRIRCRAASLMTAANMVHTASYPWRADAVSVSFATEPKLRFYEALLLAAFTGDAASRMAMACRNKHEVVRCRYRMSRASLSISMHEDACWRPAATTSAICHRVDGRISKL